MDMTFVGGTYCDIMAESLNSRVRTVAVASQWLINMPPTSTDVGHHWATAHLTRHTTVEESIGAVFSMWSVPRQYNKDQWDKLARISAWKPLASNSW